jgi:two-component system, OmpR family, KDP operon response regulator KdpE
MSTKKVMIVDDDPVARRVEYQALAAERLETIIAADATMGLNLARTHKPDLILLDLGLPGGGGFTFLERLRKFPQLALTPVIVISGLDRATNEPRAMESGAVEYLEKPVSPERLVAIVRRVLGEEPPVAFNE